MNVCLMQVQCILGDICKEQVHCVVNPVSSSFVSRSSAKIASTVGIVTNKALVLPSSCAQAGFGENQRDRLRVMLHATQEAPAISAEDVFTGSERSTFGLLSSGQCVSTPSFALPCNRLLHVATPSPKALHQQLQQQPGSRDWAKTKVKLFRTLLHY